MKKTCPLMVVTAVAWSVLSTDVWTQETAGGFYGPPLVSSEKPLVAPSIETGQHHVGRFEITPSTDTLNLDAALKRSAAQKIIPLWNGSFIYNKVNYPATMVGTYPFTKQTAPATSIHAVIIPIKFIFMPQNVTFDPTVIDPACSPKFTPLNLAKASPAFASRPMTIGVQLGTGQFADLFQRANFWDYTKPGAINEGYHVSLNPITVAPTFFVQANNYTVHAAKCGKLGMIKKADWDAYLKSFVIPQYKAWISPTEFPIFLFYNVVFYSKTSADCCIGGYHSWFANPAFANAEQTYANSVYITNDAVENFADASVLVHEIAEWVDDPLVNNTTPSWGHIGQIADCSTVLEVGDPLTGTHETISYNNLTFHVQDLAFVPWFLRATSKGNFSLLKRYSLYGTLTSPPKDCK